MSSLINSLKSEISRVARKELKQELLALRKTTATHRSEIAELKRQVRSLASALKAAVKTPKATKKDSSIDGDVDALPKIRFSPGRLTSIRNKLGISQAQMASLLGVSYLSVHKWEAGGSVPRAAQLQKISAIAKLGKREVLKKLQ